MSGHSRAQTRAAFPVDASRYRRRGLAPLAAVALTGLLVGGLAGAEPLSGVRILDAGAARDAGVAIAIDRRVTPHGTLVVVSHATGSTPVSTDRVLAVSAEGDMAAVTDSLGSAGSGLTIARADRAQVQLRLPGIASAGFAPGGAWLAVIDAAGDLWRVDTASGTSGLLAAGPFIGPPLVATDGSVALLSVPSVEAPWRSSAVRIDPSSGVAMLLSDEPLVYAVLGAAGPRLLLAVHRPDGLRIREEGVHGKILADLGHGATQASISADGAVIAFVRGDGVYLVDGREPARWLTDGGQPQVAPDGGAVLVHIGDGSVLLALDGSVLARLAHGAAMLLACSEECGS